MIGEKVPNYFPTGSVNLNLEIMKRERKPVAWLHGEVKIPPFSPCGRIEAGELLVRLQCGETLGMPHSRPMPDIGARCHELRIKDDRTEWRIIYRLDADAVLVLEVFTKKTRATPKDVIQKCRRRLREYDALS